MRTLTKVICMCLGAGLLLANGLALAAGPLKVGISAEPYPPFTYKASSGDWTGFEVEVADAICAELGRDCVTTPTAWSGIIPALNSGKIDMIIGSMSITEKRAKLVNFSDPYYNTGFAFVAPKSMDIDIPEGLAGKVLGVQSATMAAKHAREQLAPAGVRLKFYPKQEQLNRDLLAHRVDLMIADAVAMYPLIQRDEASSLEIKKVTEPYAKGMGVVLRKADTELLDQVNTAVAAIIDDGQCEALSKKYFGADICGG